MNPPEGDGTRHDPEATYRDIPPDATQRDPGTRPYSSYGSAAVPPSADAVGDADADGDIRLRFGTGPAAPRVWQPTPRRRRSRLAPVLSILVSVAVIAGVAFYLLQGRDGLAVTAAPRVEAPKGALQCDRKTSSRKVRIVAVLTLNGRAGELTYRWTQSDGEPQPPVHVKIGRGEKTREIPLDWTVSGPGRTKLTATFELLEPTAKKAAGSFTYSCR